MKVNVTEFRRNQSAESASSASPTLGRLSISSADAPSALIPERAPRSKPKCSHPVVLRRPRQEFATNGERQNVIRIGKIAFINSRCAKHGVRISPQHPDQHAQCMDGPTRTCPAFSKDGETMAGGTAFFPRLIVMNKFRFVRRGAR